MAAPYPSQDEVSRIETALYERLKASRDAYRQAKQARSEAARLHAIARDVGLNTSDGILALRQAVQIEHEALASFSAALGAFNDLVQHLRLPKDLPQLPGKEIATPRKLRGAG